MIQVALHGEGEPAPTLLQTAEQAVKIELFTQWQTYRNGVHMDRDTFDSIDFRALAVAAITGAGFTVTAVEAAIQAQREVNGRNAKEQVYAYNLDPETIAEHGRQVNG